mmetsp:Transcript_8928/g.54918  ORF Transcript_8928/g.54918 Transcript_8928/m.54918 type:complete len:90 (+) Transcript_8928:800-1069(+)
MHCGKPSAACMYSMVRNFAAFNHWPNVYLILKVNRQGGLFGPGIPPRVQCHSFQKTADTSLLTDIMALAHVSYKKLSSSSLITLSHRLI